MPKGSLAVPHNRQEQTWTCVPACVRMVLASLGDHREKADIAQQLKTTPFGTRLSDLFELERWGYQIEVAKGDLKLLDALLSDGVPVIVAVHTSHLPYCPLPPWDAHVVLVVGASRAGFIVNDPAQPNAGIRLSRGALNAAWALRRNQMATIRPIQ